MLLDAIIKVFINNNLNIAEKGEIMKVISLMIKKALIISFVVIVWSGICFAEVMKITSPDEIPLDNARDVILNGELYRVAAATEPIAKGISKARAFETARRVATLKAKNMLVQSIYDPLFNSSEFNKAMQDTIEKQGEYQTKHISSYNSEISNILKDAVLKGAVVLEVDQRNPNEVRVVMGVSARSMKTADYFKEGMTTHNPDSGISGQDKDNYKPSRDYWVDPRFKKRGE